MNRRMDELLGTPFEDHGRGSTLDCTGLALELWRAGGVELPDPVTSSKAVEALASTSELVQEVPRPEPGCLVVIETIRGTTDHVGVLLGEGLVGHAARGVGAVRTQLRTLIGRCDGRRRRVRYYVPR